MKRSHQEIVEHAQTAEEAPPLRTVSDPARDDALRAPACDVLAIEGHRAAPHRHESGYRREQRALACAVGAKNRHDLSGAHLEAHIPQHLRLAVTGVEVK